ETSCGSAARSNCRSRSRSATTVPASMLHCASTSSSRSCRARRTGRAWDWRWSTSWSATWMAVSDTIATTPAGGRIFACTCPWPDREGRRMARRALLVEDDASIATVITAGLEAEGFSVDRCDSIADRDRRLAQNDYSVMLTDVILADGDGIATLDEVQRAYPRMPVIILSAQNTLDTAVRATETGAFEYFPKPFDLDELVRAVRQAADARG